MSDNPLNTAAEQVALQPDTTGHPLISDLSQPMQTGWSSLQTGRSKAAGAPCTDIFVNSSGRGDLALQL